MEINTNPNFLLGKGYIELLDYMGSDTMILETARVSTGAINDTERNKGLMNFLIRNDHLTPLESCVFRFKVKAPIFVARQWVKHRMSSWNEKSARYQDFGNFDCYYPSWKHEGEKGAPTDTVDVEEYFNYGAILFDSINSANLAYNDLTQAGVAKEQARVVMPVGAFTEWIWTVNLSSLYNFLKLRTSDHAQYEIRVYANAILKILKDLPEFPYAVEALSGMIEFDREVKRLLNIVKDPKIGASTISELLDEIDGIKEDSN